MTLKSKKILVRVGEVTVFLVVLLAIHKCPVLSRKIFQGIGAWQLGRLVGLAGNTLVKQYETEEKSKNG